MPAEQLNYIKRFQMKNNNEFRKYCSYAKYPIFEKI